MPKEDIAARIKTAREKLGLTQEEVSNLICSTPQKVSSFETGRTRIDIDTLVKLCEIYGVDVNEIIGTKREPDDELLAYLEELRYRSEMRMLFKTAKNATKEDVEKAVKIIEMFKSESGKDI